ncbi:MAG: TetR/AcrR family transcriptional regulator [Frankia sp.]
MRPIPASIATKILDAAELFAERGLDGSKMSDIAAATGIPRATLYYHFEGKEAVFSYMCTVLFDAFEDAVSTALAGPGVAAERLSRVIRAQIELYAANPIALQAVHLDLGRAARRPEIFKRAAHSYVRPVAALLEEGAIDGSLRKVAKPRTTAAAILGAITIAAEQTLSSTDDRGVSELHDTMMSLVLQGVEAQPFITVASGLAGDASHSRL